MKELATPRFIGLFFVLILFDTGAAWANSRAYADDPQAALVKNLVGLAYKYRLKGRFSDAERVLRKGIEILSIENDGDLRAAELKIELARVIIRKTFHSNTSSKEPLALYKETEAIALKAKDDKLLGKALYGIGYYKFKLGAKSWDGALLDLKKSLTIRRRIGDTFGVSQSLFTIGTIHQRRRKPQKLVDGIYAESLRMANQAGSTYMEGENERHIGYQFYLRGNMKTALVHFFRALEKRRRIGYTDGEIFALITIGQTYERLGQLKTAKRYLKEALPLARSIDSKVSLARIYSTLGKVFYAQKENRKATISLTRAQRISGQIGYQSTEKAAKELLTKLRNRR